MQLDGKRNTETEIQGWDSKRKQEGRKKTQELLKNSPMTMGEAKKHSNKKSNDYAELQFTTSTAQNAIVWAQDK